jgi:dipeptidyl aminopeptidase/acylaminoacyl peptidase
MDASQDPMWTYVTSDGQTLLFNNAQAGSRNLWLLPLSGAMPPRQLTTIAGDAVMHSSLSPDGARVAFVSTATGNADIWVQHVDGSGLRQLTNDSAADAWPVWSPDGRTIVFSSASAEARNQIRLVSADGGPAQKFADGFFRVDWTADPDGPGTLIVTSDGTASIRFYEVEQRRVRWEDRRAGPGGTPMFSADGRSISHYFRDQDRRDAIAVYDTATGARRVEVRFAEPFQIFFRASWVDNDRAFVVNRVHTMSHIVMLDRFWPGAAASPRP